MFCLISLIIFGDSLYKGFTWMLLYEAPTRGFTRRRPVQALQWGYLMRYPVDGLQEGSSGRLIEMALLNGISWKNNEHILSDLQVLIEIEQSRTVLNLSLICKVYIDVKVHFSSPKGMSIKNQSYHIQIFFKFTGGKKNYGMYLFFLHHSAVLYLLYYFFKW